MTKSKYMNRSGAAPRAPVVALGLNPSLLDLLAVLYSLPLVPLLLYKSLQGDPLVDARLARQGRLAMVPHGHQSISPDALLRRLNALSPAVLQQQVRLTTNPQIRGPGREAP